MNREAYLLISIFVIAIVAMVAYREIYSNPSLDISVGFSSGNVTVYPLEKVSLPVLIKDYKGNLKDLSVGIYVNGQLTYTYNVSMPAGREELINYTYMPKVNGEYMISAIADPGNLYNIADRKNASSSVTISVLNVTASAPYSNLPVNAISESYENVSGGAVGYVVSSYLAQSYLLNQFSLSNIRQFNNFMSALLNLTGVYELHYSVASASYANGTDIASVWMYGYPQAVTPLIGEAASEVNANYRSIEVGGENVTFIGLGSGAGACEFYQGGWIKIVGYDNYMNCTDVLSVNNGAPINTGIDVAQPSNTMLLGRYNTLFSNGSASSGILFERNREFGYLGVWNDSPFNRVCNGAESYTGNVYYCTAAVSPVFGFSSNFSLFMTSSQRGSYNVSALYFANTLLAANEMNYSIGLLKNMSFPGTSFKFIQGGKTNCNFYGIFGCSVVGYGNGTIGLLLTNNFNQSVRIGSVGCYLDPPYDYARVGKNVSISGSLNVSAGCYDNGALIGGYPSGLAVNLTVNYTLNKRSLIANGTAYIV